MDKPEAYPTADSDTLVMTDRVKQCPK
jgi:hypothetical protein